MFSDDRLMERLVLKGGNLLDIVYGVAPRASMDIDFSIDRDFDLSLQDLRAIIEGALQKTFAEVGLVVFDFDMDTAPRKLSDSLKHLWGGYKIEFKLIDHTAFAALKNSGRSLQMSAIAVGLRGSPKVHVDISKYEYCNAKRMEVLDGYTIFVYPPQMVVAEKLRAICQQMPAYCELVKSPPAPRARDFIDLCVVADHFGVQWNNSEFLDLVRSVFQAKRVPLELIQEIHCFRDFHAQDFPSVKDTLKPDFQLEPFDSYFDRVVECCRSLESLWNE
jgi:hypothetical protein